VKKWQEDWLLAFTLVLDKASGWDWLNILLISGGFFVLGLMMYWQLQRNDGFDLRELFAIQHREKPPLWRVAPGKCFQTGAFMITSWGFVTVTVHDKLTEMYLVLYAVCWAASPVMKPRRRP
jgi:hypothetical protein